MAFIQSEEVRPLRLCCHALKFAGPFLGVPRTVSREVGAQENLVEVAKGQHVCQSYVDTSQVDTSRNLGSGSFADVVSGTYRFPGQQQDIQVAFKILSWRLESRGCDE